MSAPLPHHTKKVVLMVDRSLLLVKDVAVRVASGTALLSHINNTQTAKSAMCVLFVLLVAYFLLVLHFY